VAERVDQALSELRRQEPEHPTPEQAEHWLEVYEQLIAMTELMLEKTREYLSGLHPPGRRHVERVNVRVMEEELAGFRDRHRVWAQRVQYFDN
jgi:hypothetical protein